MQALTSGLKCWESEDLIVPRESVFEPLLFVSELGSVVVVVILLAF